MPKQNQDIRLVQTELVKRLRQLQAALDETNDFDTAQAIVREMQEVSHRIAIAGSLLFAAGAGQLAAKTDEVRKASTRAAQAIRDFKEITDITDAVTGFLGLVDEVLDLAKAL